ncbi:protein kinase [Corallococcus sp. Z5C101001]|uniref:serine/threonine protein kinase n=1 Tax=Corallococcus sp. Z5C101001 TaxID=2596829 RepID=UPI00117F99B9|nr:protein kinase [Corallococcus sp. Z5C101001]TSC20320.1 protein kinase [Corallococcus sp. Z5C101001]
MSSGVDLRLAGGTVLFCHDGTAYEFFQDLGIGRNGERVLFARPRTASGYRGKVIVKCVPLPQGPATDEFQRVRARLEEEVRLAQFLQHPNIARVHGLFEMKFGEVLALGAVMECVEGFSLNTLLTIAQTRGRYFSEAFVLYVGAEVAAALAHAHTRTDDAGNSLGIVNRDINPGCIRLRPSGGVALTDFGVACSRLQGRIATTLPRPPGDVIYASPEALLGEETDAHSDLFSLGLVLLEFATGRHLYYPGNLKHEDEGPRLSREQHQRVLAALATTMDLHLPPFVEEAIQHAMTYRVKDVASATFGLSQALRSVFHRLLYREPASRFATAAALEVALRAQLAQKGAYGATNAVNEVEAALLEGGESLEELSLMEDEGGIVPAFPPPSPDDIRTEPRPLRSADETTTEPQPGARRLTRH